MAGIKLKTVSGGSLTINPSDTVSDYTVNLPTGNADLVTTAKTYSGMKNRIINGAMVINQRAFNGSISATGATYTLDRWTVYATQASKMSVSQNTGSVTPPVGFVNYLGITSSSAYTPLTSDVFHLSQYIEGYNWADAMYGTASAKTLTLTFWVRSSLTGIFAGSLENVNNDRAYPFTYSINAANTWEQKTITVAGDTTGTWNTGIERGLSVRWNLLAGTDYNGTVNTWQSGDKRSVSGTVGLLGTNGATFYITGVQVELGSVATDFDYRDYGIELAMCQRYYYVHASGASKPLSLGSYSGTNYIEGYAPFKVSMRISPSLVTVSGTNYYGIYRAGAADTFNSLSLDAAINTNTAIIYNNTEVSGTAGDVGNMYTNNAASLVAFTAEL